MARLTLKSQGELASFLSAGKAEIRSLKVHFTPKQAGTGDPSPENVREISGWTGVEATKCGKNLCPAATGTEIAEWPVLSNPNRVYKITGLPPNEPFTLSATITETTSNATTKRLYLTGGTSTFISTAAAGRHSITVNSKSDGTLTITHNKNGLELVAEYITDVQLELGSTATPYEPYTGTTYNLDWTDTLGTIYGGYVDLISGEVVEEWGIIASYNGESLASEWLSDRDVYASGTTPTIGAQVAYELATPITHQLTPTEIQTLIGQNNFWSSADSIEVEYDLIETRDTWMNRKHMFAISSPHAESLTGTMLQFETDMTSRLKECRVHFTPIQEGSGDPSPDNVRPIHGWNGVTLTACGKNLFDKASHTITPGRGINYSTGGLSGLTSSSRGYTDYIAIKGGQPYTLSCTTVSMGAGSTWGLAFYDSEKIYISGIANTERTAKVKSFTSPDNASFFRATFTGITSAEDALNEIQLELGSEATDYEPYTAQSLTIPFPQTIYGGYVDLVKGEVVEEWSKVTFTELVHSTGSSNNSAVTTKRAGRMSPYMLHPEIHTFYIPAISNQLTLKQSSFWNETNFEAFGVTYSGYKNGDDVYFAFYNSTIAVDSENDTPQQRTDKMNAYLEENPLEFCYELATPTTYPLDPVTIRTLRGLNNIWSDANGNIEIKYWTH